ncbi:MAG: alpha-L-fucosidase [Nitrososphaerota archaeon]|nr:alpha-L-fucosidase [Candidatus Calditenuaceae archaeon]MDW8073474.1 alpha-L-fucosidase [Nitrososphaerota archaeon]
MAGRVASLEEAYRQIHLDFHTSPLIPDVAADFDPHDFAETLAQASVNSVTVFAKCHHGMSYYETRVGVKHPSLKIDLLREMVEACHRRAIRVAAYYSVCWDSHMGEEHPEWLQVDSSGAPLRPRPFERPYYSWETLCLNTPYVEYVEAQLREILDSYDVDGVFLDIVGQRRPGCICRYCRASMSRLGMNYSVDEDLRRHSRMIEERFMARMWELVSSLRPSATLFFNGASNLNIARLAEKYMTHFEIESLPTGPWGYYHFPLYARYLRNLGKPIVGMTGRFHLSWADFGGVKPLPQLVYEAGRILAHGAAVSVGDQMHPRGALDRAVYSVVGGAYGVVKTVEELARGSEPLYEAAVLALPRSRGADPYVFHEGGFGMDDSLAGAVKVLLEEKIQFNVLDPLMDFQGYGLLIIPDFGLLDEAARQKLAKFISMGGGVIFSYKATLENGAFRCPGINLTPVEADKYDVDFIRVGPRLAEGVPADFDVAMYGSGVYTRIEGGETLARVREPYFRRSYRAYTSHTYTPASKDSESPAIALSRDGKVMYIYSPIFAAYFRHGYWVYKTILRNCLNLMLRERLVHNTLPPTSEAYLWRKTDSLILHLVNYQSMRIGRHPEYMSEYTPYSSLRLRVRTAREPVRVYSPLRGRELRYDFSGGMVEVVLEAPNVYEVVVLEGAAKR